jgi:hypothetical protein
MIDVAGIEGTIQGCPLPHIPPAMRTVHPVSDQSAWSIRGLGENALLFKFVFKNNENSFSVVNLMRALL